MFGAGQRVMFRLFPEIYHLHNDHNPGFHGQAPEPIHKNLLEFSNFIKQKGDISCGLATDGDADRIGLYDSKGNFVDSHHIILLLIHYLVKYKNQTGKVATAFSTTVKIKNMRESSSKYSHQKRICIHLDRRYEILYIFQILYRNYFYNFVILCFL